ncbi:MAG: 30S ribosomal protein S3 [Candidatus ainarchaeum sp.]|nr:30S ribosomal protein S3 [Candidatus ainarchaeum sp.]
MVYEKKFIEEPILQYEIMKFLEKGLDRTDLANIDIQRTPVVTRITLEVMNPGKIIGKRGGVINQLTETLQKEFNIKNPQISVVEVRHPSLEPRIMGRRAAKMLEMGKKARMVLHYLLREIMSAGAIGSEIIVSGTMSRGSRAKRMSVIAGFIPKAGEPARLVKEAHVTSVTKYGAIGIFVRIVPPGTVFPDTKVAKVELPKVIKSAVSPLNPVEKPK